MEINIFGRLQRFLHSFCTFLGAVLLVFAIALGVIQQSRTITIPDKSVLMVDFSDNFPETSSSSLIDEVMNTPTMSFHELVQVLTYAAKDEKVHSLVARIDVSSLNFAQIQDVASVVSLLQRKGKKTYVFSQGFGSPGMGNREYFLASYFDEIYMQPHTSIGLTGISFEIPFGRELLKKMGIQPEFYSRYEYKTAMASFTDDKISAPYKEEMERLGNSLMSVLEEGITTNRQLNEKFMTIVNKAPISSEEGLKLNLIDGMMYLSDLEKKIRDDGGQAFVNIRDYADYVFQNKNKNANLYAVLTIDGLIDTGKSSTELDGAFTTGSLSVLADLDEISHLPDLKGIIVRINSPGGSYNAADEIYYALKKLKEEKKIPIIISQSGYAASGGYYISLAGDYIIAEPSTITGSIGVLGGKFVLGDLWKKLGVNWTTLKFGENSDIMSINKPFSESEKAVFNASLDDVYQDFTAKVIENRPPLKKPMDEIARGRVWTGAEAKELGLVDYLGNFNEAIIAVQSGAFLPPHAPYRLVYYPKQKSFGEKLSELILDHTISVRQFISENSVNIRELMLFKRLQYDTVLLPFNINM